MSECESGKKPASEIAVRNGRLTLLWPLTLHMQEPPGRASVVDYTADGFANDVANAHEAASPSERLRLWAPVDDPLEHYPRPDPSRFAKGIDDTDYRAALVTWESDAYAEALYFHEFVQAFLYRKHPEAKGLAPFRLFRRSDVRHARVVFGEGNIQKIVAVERVNLYIFRTGVAVLALDMVMPEIAGTASCGWSLAEFEDFHDFMRRAYAPFFFHSGIHRTQGHLVIKSISWLDEFGIVLRDAHNRGMSFDLSGDVGQVEEYVGHGTVEGKRYPPVFRHWRALLPEQFALAPYQEPCQPNKATTTSLGDISAKARWHHVVDERMPTLATLDMTDEQYGDSRLRSISRSDFVRLCFADNRGESGYPYDKDFLADFEKNHCYDRFFSEGTRYMVSGYSFVAISAGGFSSHLLTHMKRHYFQMALMAHMEVASLLGFSGQISRAVQSFGNDVEASSEIKFEQAMAAIQEQFLLFVHRFRFTGVSNQLQGQELFDLWRRQLRSDELFQDVQAEVSVANDYLQARADRRTSDASEKLTLVGTIAVLIGTVIGILGMNFLLVGDDWKDSKGHLTRLLSLLPGHGFVAGCVIASVGAAGFVGFQIMSDKKVLGVLAPVRTFSIAMVIIGIVVLVLAKPFMSQ